MAESVILRSAVQLVTSCRNNVAVQPFAKRSRFTRLQPRFGPSLSYDHPCCNYLIARIYIEGTEYPGERAFVAPGKPSEHPFARLKIKIG